MLEENVIKIENPKTFIPLREHFKLNLHVRLNMGETQGWGWTRRTRMLGYPSCVSCIQRMSANSGSLEINSRVLFSMKFNFVLLKERKRKEVSVL